MISSTPTAKRPINLTLNAGTVEQARRYTNNLSATVDGLLAEFVAREAQARQDKLANYAKVSEAWNKFDQCHGTYGSEYSPL